MHYFNFESIENIDDVAKELGCQTDFIGFALNSSDMFYHRILVPKKRRKEHRIVYKVDDRLKNLHKNILISISQKACFPECVQGFVFKRSIVTNASLHLAKKCILNLDIKDFFESIKIEKIVDVFIELGCNETVASIFAKLCTLNGCLVQGANTSPILANLVCKDLDQELTAIALETNCSYSRYADDITFSGELVPKDKKIALCIRKHGFNLNPNKRKFQRRGKPQYVTGLTVFDEAIPRLPKKMKRKLRQELYYIQKYGLSDHFDKVDIQEEEACTKILDIDGLIAFMYSVEPKYAYRFDIAWQAIRTKEGEDISRNPSKIFKKIQSQEKLINPEFLG